MNPLTKPRWNPYLVGVLIGMLSWATFGLMNKALGTSTTMVHLSGLAVQAVDPGHLTENAYYAKSINEKKAMFDWQFALVLMLPAGAALAAWWGRSFADERVPALWAWRFGPNKWKRYFAAFAGGAVLLFGARMAGGCTSGHGISGGLQLAVSSYTFFVAMFMAGTATAFVLFGKEGRRHV